TSNGQPITVSIDPSGKYVGKTPNGTEIFTLEINNSGVYKFTLKGVLDHANGSNPDDIIDLRFDYTARDADGDASEGSIIIHVKDDAPIAHADVNSVNGGPANGNVVTGVHSGGNNGADDLSEDAPNLLKEVSFGSTTKTFAT